jgi:hypothetical protein
MRTSMSAYRRLRSAALLALPAIVVLVLAAMDGGEEAMGARAGEPDSGGTLTLRDVRSLNDTATLWEGFIGLDRYAGAPITALQLKVIADAPLRVSALEHAAGLGDPAGWEIYTHSKPSTGKGIEAAPDTMNALLLSRTQTSDLPSGTYPRLLRCVFRLRDSGGVKGGRCEVRTAAVIAASARGEDMHVVPGLPVPVSVSGQ